MNKELITNYKKLLFPSKGTNLKTYALIDSLRDKEVINKVFLSDLKYKYLWHDELFINSQKIPIFLVELQKDNDILDYLLSKTKESIATYFISSCSLKELQGYYSKFTHANIEVKPDDFRKGIFGFYDPNILPNYIQTLYNQEKINEVFAGINAWLSPCIESNNSLFVAFKDKLGNLNNKTLLLENLEDKDIFHDKLEQAGKIELQPHEIYIDRKQIEIFDYFEKIRYINGVLREYKVEGQVFYFNEERNKELAYGLYDEAKSLDIVSEAGIYRYILLGLTVLRPMNELKRYRNIVDLPNEADKIKVMNKMMNEIIERRRKVNVGCN